MGRQVPVSLFRNGLGVFARRIDFLPRERSAATGFVPGDEVFFQRLENDGDAFASRASGLAGSVLCLLVLASVLVGVALPRAMAPVGIAGGIFLAAAFWWDRGRPPLWPRALIGALAIFVLYILLSTLWAREPRSALWAVTELTYTLTTLIFCVIVMRAVPAAQRERASRLLVWAVAAAAVLMLVEVYLGQPLSRLAQGRLPGDGGPPLLLNRSLAVMAAFVWPAAAWCWVRGQRAAAFTLIAAHALVAASGSSASARLGLISGSVMWLLAWWRPRLGLNILAGTFLTSVLMWPLLAIFLDHLGLATADWLFGSARHRVEMWSFATSKIAEAPIFGWGLNASRFLGEGLVTRDMLLNGQPVALMTLHPHNAMLQLWLELGAVGVFMVAIAGVAVLIQIARIPDIARVPQVAGFMAAVMMASTAYGAWQVWWINTLGLAGIFLFMILPPHMAGEEGDISLPSTATQDGARAR